MPGAIDFKEPVREVVYENVSFRYEEGDAAALHGINILANVMRLLPLWARVDRERRR